MADVLERFNRLREQERVGASATLGGPDASAERMMRLFDARKGGTEIDDTDVAAAFVGQESVSGDPLPMPARFLMNFLGDTFDEQRATFSAIRPEGEIVQVPNTDVVLFRDGPDEKFRKVDPGFFESLAKGDVISESLSDVTELLGDDAFVLPLEVAFTRGATTFLRGLARAGLGAAAGESISQGVQTAAGTQRQSLGEQAGEAGFKATASIVGGTLGDVVGRGANLTFGRALLLEPTKEGSRAFRAAASLRRAGVDVEDPLPIQVVDIPVIQLLGRQAARLHPRIGRALRKAEDNLSAAMRGLTDRPARARIREESVRVVQETSDDLVEMVIQANKVTRRDPAQAGRLLKSTVQDWWSSTGRIVDDLYARARAIEEPEFDLEPAIAVARRIRNGVRGPGKEVEVQIGVDGNGNPITEVQRPLVQTRNLPAELRRNIDRLLQLDPELPPVEGADPAMDVLREIRGNLADLALPGPEGARRPNFLAGEIRDAIQEVMDSPSNSSTEFVGRWKAAQVAASKRFRTREQAAVVDLLRTENVRQFADQLMNPGSFEGLAALSRAGGRRALRPVQEAFQADLLKDGFAITEKLGQYDGPTLRMLVTKSEERVLRQAGSRFDELRRSGLRDAIEKQTRVRPFVRDLVENPSSAGIDALRGVVEKSGGREGPLGTSVRSAVIDELWQRSHRVVKGRRILQPDLMNKVFDDFNERGLLQFLSFGEKKILRNVELMTRVSEVVEDAGTSLQAASAVAGLRNPFDAAFSGALTTFIEQMGVGRLLTSDAGRRFLSGVGGTKKPLAVNAFRMAGAVAGTVTASTSRETPESQVSQLEEIRGRLYP